MDDGKGINLHDKLSLVSSTMFTASMEVRSLYLPIISLVRFPGFWRFNGRLTVRIVLLHGLSAPFSLYSPSFRKKKYLDFILETKQQVACYKFRYDFIWIIEVFYYKFIYFRFKMGYYVDL